MNDFPPYEQFVPAWLNLVVCEAACCRWVGRDDIIMYHVSAFNTFFSRTLLLSTTISQWPRVSSYTVAQGFHCSGLWTRWCWDDDPLSVGCKTWMFKRLREAGREGLSVLTCSNLIVSGEERTVLIPQIFTSLRSQPGLCWTGNAKRRRSMQTAAKFSHTCIAGKTKINLLFIFD